MNTQTGQNPSRLFRKLTATLPQPRNFLQRTFWHASCNNNTCPWSTENLPPRKKRLSVLVKRLNRLTLRVDFTTFNARSEKRPPTASSPDGLLTYRRSIEKLATFSKRKNHGARLLYAPFFLGHGSLCAFSRFASTFDGPETLTVPFFCNYIFCYLEKCY